MNKSPVTIAKFMARHEFLSSLLRSRNYDPSRPYPRPVTDDEVLARSKFLKAENACLRESLDRNVKSARVEVEVRAKANAEQLMRQVLGNKN